MALPLLPFPAREMAAAAQLWRRIGALSGAGALGAASYGAHGAEGGT